MRSPRTSALLAALLAGATALFAQNAAQQDPPGFIVQPGTGMKPEETARLMKVPDGFSVKVFAGEPDVFQPIAFTIDDRGRLWVVEKLQLPRLEAGGK
jgi:hypothetical protein